MNNIPDTSHQAVKKKPRLREKFISLLGLMLVIAISVALFRYRDKVAILDNYGYMGAFLVGLVGDASIILPTPGFLVLLTLSTIFNPVLVGLAGATGGILGEMTAYMAGYSGRGIIKEGRVYARMEGWMRRWGGWTIFVFAIAPFLLFDLAGLTAGILRYPLWKFLLVGWMGKSLKYIALLSAGAWGWGVILNYFTRVT